MTSDQGAQIIDMAREMGAVLAGIASVEQLQGSPSHQVLNSRASIVWPAAARSVLVIAVSHPRDQPELDWWDASGSPGNRALIQICEELSLWVERALGVQALRLPYSVRRGGTYLKDAAVLAGLGCIGKNNLLVTPEFGPRVRLRAMLLGADLAPTGPIAFDPCQDCEDYCRDACPQHAFDGIGLSPVGTSVLALPGRDGRFTRARCMLQMSRDVQHAGTPLGKTRVRVPIDRASHVRGRIRYCRRCELACPVGGRSLDPQAHTGCEKSGDGASLVLVTSSNQ